MSELTPEQTCLQDRLRGGVYGLDRIPLCIEAADKIDALTKELETERMRLAACGVVAMSNTPESTAKAREMHADYRSASLEDVCAAVDREMELRAERDAALAELAKLREQKPVGFVPKLPIPEHVGLGIGIVATNELRNYQVPLYAHPVPAQPVTREGCNYLAMQGTVCNKCGEVHK